MLLYETCVRNLLFLWVASTCYPVFKVVAKLTVIIGGHVTAKLHVRHIVRFITKQNSIWSKALIMPLILWNCVSSYKKKTYFSENRLVLPRNYFQNRIPRYMKQLIATYILKGAKLDFEVANLLLATVIFEPCVPHVQHTSPRFRGLYFFL